MDSGLRRNDGVYAILFIQPPLEICHKRSKRWLIGVLPFIGAAEHRSDRWMRSLFESFSMESDPIEKGEFGIAPPVARSAGYP